jgi:hypothetical protein
MARVSARDPLDSRRPFWSLLGVSAVPLAIGMLLGEAPGETASAGLGDLREAHIVEVRDASGQVALSGELRSRTNRTGAEEKDAALIAPDGRSVVGEIEIEIPRPDALNPQQELEVDIIHLVPRSAFTVVIDDRPVLSFQTDDRGSVDIEVEEPLRVR